MAKSLSFLDWTFWLTETQNNPKHVAGFHLFTMPENADINYCTDLIKHVKEFNEGFFPFDSKVVSFMRCAVGFKKVEKLDMDYHVQHHKIEDINNLAELHKYIAKLHEPMLDRGKPLWKMHLIEDGKNKKFSLFFIVHHIYGDGASLVSWFNESYQVKPSEEFIPAWATERKSRIRKKKNFFLSIFSGLWHLVVILFDVSIILFRLLLKFIKVYPVYMPLPFSGTKTLLTGQVSSGRVVATTSVALNEVKALSLRMRASINEIILCCFDIGIHKFLKDYGQQFDRPLITQMPINMRRPNDPVGGNKIAIVPVELAHGKKDPYLRLRQIIENHRIVKGVAKRVYPASLSYYTILIQGLALTFEFFRLSSVVKPLGNILISNMRGPEQPLYFKDSRLDALYPVSALTPGGGINITLLTYQGKADIGLVCCDKNIKSLEPLAVYFNEAFELLKNCVDDPNLTIDDLGELPKAKIKSVLNDDFLEQDLESYPSDDQK